MRMNKDQLTALHRKWLQNDQGMSFLAFRRTVARPPFMNDCVLVLWCGMYLGIEADGYTHS